MLTTKSIFSQNLADKLIHCLIILLQYGELKAELIKALQLDPSQAASGSVQSFLGRVSLFLFNRIVTLNCSFLKELFRSINFIYTQVFYITYYYYCDYCCCSCCNFSCKFIVINIQAVPSFSHKKIFVVVKGLNPGVIS